MDKIKLVDGTTIDIEDGASLANITHIATNEAGAMFVCGKVTPENVTHLDFLHGDAVTGSYDHIVIATPTTREDGENGAIIVRMHFREKTELEQRVDALEVSQEIQDGALEDLGAAVSEMAEV